MAGKTLANVEIFSVGQWTDSSGNTDNWTEKDLQEIARNFPLTKKIHKAPFKFGHADAQKFMGQRDGAPALGWADNVRVENGKLIADFTDVPKEIFELINAGRYKRVSAEFYEDVSLDGKPIGRVLRAVALLGADIPAVTNLKDLQAVMMTDGQKPPFQFKSFKQFETDQPKEKAKAMPTPEELAVSTQLRTFQERLESLEREKKETDQKLKQYQEREDQLKLEAKVSKFVAAKSGILAKANELVTAGKMTPALRDKLEIKIAVQEKRYSESDGLQVPAEWVLDLFAEVAPAKVKKGEDAKHVFRDNPLKDEDEKIADPGAQLAIEAKKLMAANPTVFKDQAGLAGSGYMAAMRSVMELNPKLAKAYMEREQTAEPGPSNQAALDEARKGA